MNVMVVASEWGLGLGALALFAWLFYSSCRSRRSRPHKKRSKSKMPTLYDTTASDDAEIGLPRKKRNGKKKRSARTASMDTEGGTECLRVRNSGQKRSENSRALARREPSEDDMLLVSRVQLRDQLQDVADSVMQMEAAWADRPGVPTRASGSRGTTGAGSSQGAAAAAGLMVPWASSYQNGREEEDHEEDDILD